MQVKNIRLLHLLKSLEIGGIEKSTIIYSNELAKELSYIGIFSPKGTFSKENFIDENVQLFTNVKGQIGLNKNFFSNLEYLLKTIKQQKINLILYHFRIYLPFILIVKFFFPKTKIVYVAHSYFDDLLNYFIYADYYIAISKKVEQDLRKFRGLNVSVITHGVEARQQTAIIKSNLKVISFIGRFENHKGIDILLQAFANLSLENDALILKIVGEGQLENYIKSFREKYNLHNKILLNSPIISENELFKDIDMLIFPSTSLEGFGIVVLEAMNYGIPIIASDYIKDNLIIQDFKTGIYFKNGSVEDLVQKIESLIEDEKLRQNISFNAKEMIKSYYSIDNTLTKYLEFFQSI
jgi:glycosyltransferase involved in cell wall biosynthesis